MSDCEAMILLRPSRKIGWSSTLKILMQVAAVIAILGRQL
jgi:hypothetical protein